MLMSVVFSKFPQCNVNVSCLPLKLSLSSDIGVDGKISMDTSTKTDSKLGSHLTNAFRSLSGGRRSYTMNPRLPRSPISWLFDRRHCSPSMCTLLTKLDRSSSSSTLNQRAGKPHSSSTLDHRLGQSVTSLNQDSIAGSRRGISSCTLSRKKGGLSTNNNDNNNKMRHSSASSLFSTKDTNCSSSTEESKVNICSLKLDTNEAQENLSSDRPSRCLNLETRKERCVLDIDRRQDMCNRSDNLSSDSSSSCSDSVFDTTEEISTSYIGNDGKQTLLSSQKIKTDQLYFSPDRKQEQDVLDRTTCEDSLPSVCLSSHEEDTSVSWVCDLGEPESNWTPSSRMDSLRSNPAGGIHSTSTSTSTHGHHVDSHLEVSSQSTSTSTHGHHVDSHLEVNSQNTSASAEVRVDGAQLQAEESERNSESTVPEYISQPGDFVMKNCPPETVNEHLCVLRDATTEPEQRTASHTTDMKKTYSLQEVTENHRNHCPTVTSVCTSDRKGQGISSAATVNVGKRLSSNISEKTWWILKSQTNIEEGKPTVEFKKCKNEHDKDKTVSTSVRKKPLDRGNEGRQSVNQNTPANVRQEGEHSLRGGNCKEAVGSILTQRKEDKVACSKDDQLSEKSQKQRENNDIEEENISTQTKKHTGLEPLSTLNVSVHQPCLTVKPKADVTSTNLTRSLARWDWKTLFYNWAFPLDHVINGLRHVSGKCMPCVVSCSWAHPVNLTAVVCSLCAMVV